MHEHSTQIFPETLWKRHATEGICSPSRASRNVHTGEPTAPLETQINPPSMEEIVELPRLPGKPMQN